MMRVLLLKKDPTSDVRTNPSDDETELARPRSVRWVVCRDCSNAIAREDWILSSESDAPLFFSNPHGRAFHLLLATHAPGMLSDPSFTTEHTWFAGYAWSIGVCKSCRQHLGWQFKAVQSDHARQAFVALSRDQVKLSDVQL